MRLIITRTHGGDALNLDWTDEHGPHSNAQEPMARLTPAAQAALTTLLDWADGQLQPTLERENRLYEDEREIDRELARLTRRKAELRGR